MILNDSMKVIILIKKEDDVLILITYYNYTVVISERKIILKIISPISPLPLAEIFVINRKFPSLE